MVDVATTSKGVRHDRCIRHIPLWRNFNEQAVRKIAETARAKFEGMAGLRSKAFTLNSAKREATNFYVWDSEDAAKAFFSEELLERVTGLYGVRPSVEFVQIATLVENVRT
jgi:heme-degrading monooxygenase HmoA